jgi:hypothetical protein
MNEKKKIVESWTENLNSVFITIKATSIESECSSLGSELKHNGSFRLTADSKENRVVELSDQ